ncbi:hypothetical protein LOTGIDRAFT_154768 [Lottia gigantea]|uniref:Uncharacterized protein n=1 Tax=Lottia gigantea TaxID=225164 RepID=V4A1T7_LOTGI|nr:hypothetical protein LOTGIDRAFT_154768 [Lottia gigantea]ESO87266.1 hypothetical protein LOTGIDRAFT_154768 [Lottia gigantea]
MKERITKAARRVWKNVRKGIRGVMHNIKLKQNEEKPKKNDIRGYNRKTPNCLQTNFDVMYGVLVNEEEDKPYSGFMDPVGVQRIHDDYLDPDYLAALEELLPWEGVNFPGRIILDPFDIEDDFEDIWCEESDTTPLSSYFVDKPVY